MNNLLSNQFLRQATVPLKTFTLPSTRLNPSEYLEEASPFAVPFKVNFRLPKFCAVDLDDVYIVSFLPIKEVSTPLLRSVVENGFRSGNMIFPLFRSIVLFGKKSK